MADDLLVKPLRPLRGSEVCRVTGLSYRQLDYWCRAGVVEPAQAAHGSGTQRLFTRRQARVIAVLARLRAGGVSMAVLRRAASALASGPSVGLLVVPIDGGPPTIASEASVASLVASAGGAAIVVDLGLPAVAAA